MTLGEVKQLLYEAVVKYHSGATVVWEKTKGVTPKSPYITLGYSNLSRSQFPLFDDDMSRYYNYSFGFEVNLYTVGKEIEVDGAGTGAYENTAVENLEEFIRFLDSNAMTDALADSEVTIVLNPPIRDLSEVIGDTKFNYRSMAEFTVTFTGSADGEYGVLDSANVPNASGGGAEEFAETEIYAIEDVTIEEVTDDGN